MKVSKYIDIQQEIEVDVTSEEIAQAFSESPESYRHALNGINACAAFVKAITPEMMEQIGEPARKVIANFFTEQTARFLYDANRQTTPPSTPVRAGSAIWLYDDNRRVYAKDASGRSYGGPLYRESWREEPIIGETKMSWLIGPKWKPKKISKKGPHYGVCFSLAELEDKCWDYENRHRLAEKVRGATLSQLRKIDAILSEQNK